MAIEATVSSPGMKDVLRRELAEKAEIHERMFLCKGLDVDALRGVKPPPGFENRDRQVYI